MRNKIKIYINKTFNTSLKLEKECDRKNYEIKIF